MPRASWRGFLRLSLVSCPVYLSPAATRTKPIRLHQVWQPRRVAEPSEPLDHDLSEDKADRSVPPHARDDAEDHFEEASPATRIMLRPHNPSTGEEIEKEEVVKGYEFERGQFLTFTSDELKALDVESSKEIDLATFLPRGELDPIYLNTPYFMYPDGPIAVDAMRVIGAAMAEAGVIGIGRLTLSRRERAVMIEPRGTGMALFTLRAADEVRAPQFGNAEGDLDGEMVAIAGSIINQRTGKFDPNTYRDRYQEALRELIEAKMKGVRIKPKEIATPVPVIDLIAALKRSLAQDAPALKRAPRSSKPRDKSALDRRQPGLLLPVSGGRNQNKEPASKPATLPARRRKRA
jgi:DNA end-binding protein Ku